MQIFFQEISINILLACALSFAFVAGSIDFSLGGILLLSLAIVRIWRRTDFALEADLWIQILAAAVIPLLIGAIAAFVGFVISFRQRYSTLLSLAFALLFGCIGLLLMPDFGPWCEPWFCAEIFLPPSWVIWPGVIFAILVSIGTIYYFAPDFHWIRPVALTWLMIALGSFVVYEYQGLPLVVVISILALLAGENFLNQTRWGLRFRAVGSNREAARLSGIPVRWTNIFAYSLLGIFVGLSSLFEVDIVASTDIQSVYIRQVDAFVAMLLGGIAYTGGRGSLSGVALGALFVTSLNQLEWTGISSVWILALKALLILLVILMEPWLRKKFTKRENDELLLSSS